MADQKKGSQQKSGKSGAPAQKGGTQSGKGSQSNPKQTNK